jgi:hypothetical protein
MLRGMGSPCRLLRGFQFHPPSLGKTAAWTVAVGPFSHLRHGAFLPSTEGREGSNDKPNHMKSLKVLEKVAISGCAARISLSRASVSVRPCTSSKSPTEVYLPSASLMNT